MFCPTAGLRKHARVLVTREGILRCGRTAVTKKKVFIQLSGRTAATTAVPASPLMGLSVVFAPQNSEAAATAHYSPVPSEFVRPSGAVAACCSVVGGSDRLSAVASETSESTAAAAGDSSLASPPVPSPTTTTGSGAAASCESAGGSGLATASGSVCTEVVGEAGGRGAAVRSDCAAPADRGALAGKGSAAARKSNFPSEDSSGPTAAASSDFTGAASGDTLTADSDLTESAARAVSALAQCASADRTKELQREEELRLCRASFPVGKSLTIGITSPLYISTLRRNGVKLCEDRRFCSKENGIHITATGQRDCGIASRSECSSCMASRSDSERVSSISSNVTASYSKNPSCRIPVDSSTASTAGTSSSATGRATGESNNSGSSRATASGTDTSRSEGTGMFESGQCDAPASPAQAKEEQQIPTFEETQESAATRREEGLDKDQHRSDRPEEIRSLRAAIGDGPLGKLLQRFGAGNSSSNVGTVNSDTSSNDKNECSSTDVGRRAEDVRNLGGPVVQQQQHRAQQRQQPEQQLQHNNAAGKLGLRVLSSHAEGCRPLSEEHVLAPDDFPDTALFHSLQQQRLVQQRAGWHTFSEGGRITEPAAAGTAATMPLWMASLLGIPDDNSWSSYVGNDALTNNSFKHSNHHASLLVLTELQRLRGEMLQLQVAAAAAKPANIIIQNKTEVAASTETNLQQPKLHPEGPGVRERFSTWLTKFFSSRLNQVLVLCGVGLGCYMLLEHWRHTWRMAQLRRRVDSNIVLRGVQMLEESIGVRRPQSSLYY